MKKLLLSLVLILNLVSAKACNYSNWTLSSITQSAGVYTVTTNLCVGNGRTGFTMGGQDNTGTNLFFGMYGSFTYVGGTASVPNSRNNDTYYNMGFIGSGFDTETDNLMYSGTDFYACIAVPCGPPAAFCQTFVFQFTDLPDSMVVRGLEGLWPGDCNSTENEETIIFTTLALDDPKYVVYKPPSSSEVLSVEFYSILGSYLGQSIEVLTTGIYQQITRNTQGIIVDRKKIYIQN